MLPLALAVLLLSAACQREAPRAAGKIKLPKAEPVVVENGAISTAPLVPESPRSAADKKNPRTAPIDWSPIKLESGQAWLSCDLDYSRQGDGAPLLAFDRKSLTSVIHGCAERGVLRLRYVGRINANFVALVERVTRVADTLKIGKRVLDINSPGGQVEDAIRVGDFIAASRWTIWVREDSMCHSACVFILSAGDVRRIAGKVGIHRIIRMSSTATTRTELNAELRLVYGRVRDYLERNGSSVAIADLMMAVPNRSLRLLSEDELRRFGLDGVNPAQDDLDRLRLQRECGDDFVSRRDAFALAFDRQCGERVSELDELNACGLALRRNFGFPDSNCPAESPLSEFDLGQADPESVHETAESPTAQQGEQPAEGTSAEQQSQPTPGSKKGDGGN